MYEMIEAGLRGGMTQTTCKKVETNNTYMGNDSNVKECWAEHCNKCWEEWLWGQNQPASWQIVCGFHLQPVCPIGTLWGKSRDPMKWWPQLDSFDYVGRHLQTWHQGLDAMICRFLALVLSTVSFLGRRSHVHRKHVLSTMHVLNQDCKLVLILHAMLRLKLQNKKNAAAICCFEVLDTYQVRVQIQDSFWRFQCCLCSQLSECNQGTAWRVVLVVEHLASAYFSMDMMPWSSIPATAFWTIGTSRKFFVTVQTPNLSTGPTIFFDLLYCLPSFT